MAEHPKSKSTGGFNHPDGSPCTYLRLEAASGSVVQRLEAEHDEGALVRHAAVRVARAERKVGLDPTQLLVQSCKIKIEKKEIGLEKWAPGCEIMQSCFMLHYSRRRRTSERKNSTHVMVVFFGPPQMRETTLSVIKFYDYYQIRYPLLEA